jgi:hypothetical protein
VPPSETEPFIIAVVIIVIIVICAGTHDVVNADAAEQ